MNGEDEDTVHVNLVRETLFHLPEEKIYALSRCFSFSLIECVIKTLQHMIIPVKNAAIVKPNGK